MSTRSSGVNAHLGHPNNEKANRLTMRLMGGQIRSCAGDGKGKQTEEQFEGQVKRHVTVKGNIFMKLMKEYFLVSRTLRNQYVKFYISYTMLYFYDRYSIRRKLTDLKETK